MVLTHSYFAHLWGNGWGPKTVLIKIDKTIHILQHMWIWNAKVGYSKDWGRNQGNTIMQMFIIVLQYY